MDTLGPAVRGPAAADLRLREGYRRVRVDAATGVEQPTSTRDVGPLLEQGDEQSVLGVETVLRLLPGETPVGEQDLLGDLLAAMGR